MISIGNWHEQCSGSVADDWSKKEDGQLTLQTFNGVHKQHIVHITLTETKITT